MGSRVRVVVAVAAVLLGSVACSGDGPDGDRPDDEGAGATASPGTPGEGEYLPGLGATVALPDGDPRAVVVVVPGGSWRTADPTGLLPLGEDLAAEGFAVVTITYGTSSTGQHYPRPLDDVTCAMGFAAEQAPGVPVVVVGHSAGANLAVLAGLHPEQADPTCPYDHVAADGVVGLAGPYDVVRSGIGQNLFGVAQNDDPDLWADGDLYTWADERPDLPVLLVHGEADDLVPVEFTEDLATALTEAGHEVQVELVPEAGHNDVFASDAVLRPLADWLADAVLGAG